MCIRASQIGSLTETLDTVELSKDNKYSAIISHLSLIHIFSVQPGQGILHHILVILSHYQVGARCV